MRAEIMTGTTIGLALAFIVGMAGEAAAKPLNWDGTLEIDLGPLGPLRFHGGGVATVNGAGNGVQLTKLRVAGGITGSTAIPVTDPDITGTYPLIRVSPRLGTGTLSPFWPVEPWPDPQLGANRLPVRGSVLLCTFDPSCNSFQILPLTQGAGWIGVGAGGLLTAGGYGIVRVSIAAHPWTVYTAALSVDTVDGGTGVVYETGWIHGPSSFSSSVAQTGGALQLVTPVEIRSNNGLYLPGFSKLTLAFVPEPTGIAPLGTGVLALAGLLAMRRRRAPTPHRISERRRRPRVAPKIRSGSDRSGCRLRRGRRSCR
jgi:hypothetical protein